MNYTFTVLVCYRLKQISLVNCKYCYSFQMNKKIKVKRNLSNLPVWMEFVNLLSYVCLSWGSPIFK